MAFYTFTVALGSPVLLTYQGCMVESVVEKQNIDLSYSTYIVNSEVIRLGGFYTQAVVLEEGEYRVQLLECDCPPTDAEVLAIIETPFSGEDCGCLSYEQLLLIAAALGAGVGGLTTYTPSLSSDTGVGVVAAGAISFSIANVGIAAGTVDGASFPVDASVYFSAPQGGNLAAMSYDATGTTFLISEVRP